MAAPIHCFTRLMNKLLRIPANQESSQMEVPHSSPEAVDIAKYLAAKNLKDLEARFKRHDAALLMKHLPELAQYAKVWFDHTENYWLVEMETARTRKPLPLPDCIGGCPVYRKQAPYFTTYRFTSIMRGSFRIFTEGGFYNMTNAEFLADETDLCALVQAAFPRSIGLRLHPWRYIDILYPTKRALKREANYYLRKNIFPVDVCHMQFDLKVWDDKVKLPGTTTVRFDPKKKRIPVMWWLMRARQTHPDAKGPEDVQGDTPMLRDLKRVYDKVRTPETSMVRFDLEKNTITLECSMEARRYRWDDRTALGTLS